MSRQGKKIIASSSFEEIVKNDGIYVDKTEFLYKIAKYGGVYYMARPRGWGKTLMFSTLECLFDGKKELFDGLAISKTDYDFKKRPVVKIDFGTLTSKTADDFDKELTEQVKEVAKGFNITLTHTDSCGYAIDELLKELAKTERAVVLIDNYDAILFKNLDVSEKELSEIRRRMDHFLCVLKSDCGQIHLEFMTGITNYTCISIFSSANNFMWITHTDRFGNLMGFTLEEIEENFKDYIDSASKQLGVSKEEYIKKIRDMYGGNCFVGEYKQLMNPTSVIKLFENGGKDFNLYWKNDAELKFLSKLKMSAKPDFGKELPAYKCYDDSIGMDIITMGRKPVRAHTFIELLFQMGYLSIVEVESLDGFGGDIWHVDFQNNEVRELVKEM